MLNTHKVLMERLTQATWQHRHPIFLPFAISDHNIMPIKMQVFDAQANTLHQL